MNVKRILVVDDERPILTLLEYNLKQAGYDVITAADGEEGLQKAETESPDLIVLDLMLPKLDGMDVCRTLRQKGVDTPIIMLTAKSDELEKILGLELGADDYMTKPFSPREVVARIKAVLRRSEQRSPVQDTDEQAEPVYESGPLKVYPERFEAYKDGTPLEFTPKEFELLVHLISNRNRVMSRDQLLSAVWNYDFAGDTRIVDVHISHLRDKIEENTRRPVFIKTIRGTGYKFEGPQEG
ncbi:Alkaline phosphatase synthesis transcriptional regulatory protein phoP [Bhargavaea cecembensis DSE10]|uniref:Alkaline phosphatase synthesis transcriptional regulatory protein phoP n=1 Tax=Bhargavaea cecembensis DSE10 TaxID=1235279 RepID=M7NBV8_9BACL|nr:response regulator transcription factor [Bhargavaea cecembensis]EMR06073.1 Alkaline phosphatase synthesis transcriptional regulatory protein phoP [Bhargavaea cecembensis DSE10]